MEEKELKTSWKQRIFIIIIAIIMVGSIMASYIAIVVSGANSSTSDTSDEIDYAKIAELQEEYKKKQAELTELSQADYQRFVKHKSEVVKGYNETSANENGVQTNDIEKGTGDKIADDNYLAYYLGWCADETIFDSSFDNAENPTGFIKIIDPSIGMIEGWSTGVEGMRIGGIREITIPSNLAYKDSDVACGANKPLKFMVLAAAKEGELAKLSDEMTEIQMRIQYAYYGIDYDSVTNEE